MKNISSSNTLASLPLHINDLPSNRGVTARALIITAIIACIHIASMTTTIAVTARMLNKNNTDDKTSLIESVKQTAENTTDTIKNVAAPTKTTPTPATAKNTSSQKTNQSSNQVAGQKTNGNSSSATSVTQNTAPTSTATTPAPITPTIPSIPATPAGTVYALLDPGDSLSVMQQYAAMPTVDGLAYRARWSDLESSNNSYNWSSLDNALSAAQATNKKIVIHIGTTSIATPTWLKTLPGMQLYSYTTPVGASSDPVPWNTVYAQQYGDLMTAVAQHINTINKMNTVHAISTDAPVGEMTILGCANGSLGSGISYNRGSYLAAWQTTASSVSGAFPGKRVQISLPLAFLCLNDGNDGSAFTSTLINSLPNNVSFFAADLNAAGSTRSGQASATLRQNRGIDFQTIWSSSSDPSNRMQGTLSSAICKGWQAGGRYFEIYKVDLSSASSPIQQAISQARTGSSC